MPPPPAKPKVVPTHTSASSATASAPAPHAQPQPQQNMPPPQTVKVLLRRPWIAVVLIRCESRHSQRRTEQQHKKARPLMVHRTRAKRRCSNSSQRISNLCHNKKVECTREVSLVPHLDQSAEDILESVEGKRFGVLISHIFEVHDASVQDEGAQREPFVSYEVVRVYLLIVHLLTILTSFVCS